MSRLGLISELTFVGDFKRLRCDIQSIKNAQRVGRDILKPKIIECLDGSGNPTAYDLVTVPTPDGWGGYINRAWFVARFSAKHQDDSWAVPLFKLMYGNPGTPAAPGQVYASSGLYAADFTNEPGRISYGGYFSANAYGDATPIYIKVYFYATDTGTLTVTEESME